MTLTETRPLAPQIDLPVESHEHAIALDASTTVAASMLASPVIAGFFTGLLATQRSPWLVIVIRFKDDPPILLRGGGVGPGPKIDLLEHHERLFTSAGTGTLNMVDYFRDMSHGKIDVSDSQVVGVYTIPWNRADYIGNVPPQTGKINRGGVADAARAVASAKKIDLGLYAGVVVCGWTLLDLCGWVGGMQALCDSHSLAPSLLGQEMGHGYGLDHSRVDGSLEDYQDPWDTMSTANAYSAPNADYVSVGPGLNAWNMRMRGWLNEKRVVVVPPAATVVQDVVLGPLHDGGIAAAAVDVGGFLVEYRQRDRWDAGIPRSAVLVHRADANRSYLMAATNGDHDLVEGSVFELTPAIGRQVRVTVLSIDERMRRARVRVEQSIHRIHVPVLVDDWPPHIPGPGPVEDELDPRIERLRDRVDRYAEVLRLAEHYGTPELTVRAQSELAEELGRQAAEVDTTTFHEGYSFDPDRARVADPAPKR